MITLEPDNLQSHGNGKLNQGIIFTLKMNTFYLSIWNKVIEIIKI